MLEAVHIEVGPQLPIHTHEQVPVDAAVTPRGSS